MSVAETEWARFMTEGRARTAAALRESRKRFGHTAIHRAGVERLAASGANVRGFAAAIRTVCGVEMLPGERLIPDAFTIDCHGKRIALFEVVVRHDLDGRKMRRVRSLHDRLLRVGWKLELQAAYLDGAPRPVNMETGRVVLDADELRRAIDRLEARR